MKKAMFIPSSGFAHVTRTLLLAQQFKCDHDVVAILTPGFAKFAAELDIETKVVNLPPVDYRSFARDGLSLKNVETAAQVYDSAIGEFNPDFVVTSMALAARLPVKARQLPQIAIYDACNHPYYLGLAQLPSEARRTHIEKARANLDHYNAAARRMHSPEEKSYGSLFAADFNILPDLPALFPLEDLPPNYAYMGPLTWKGDCNALDPSIVIDESKPLIYVSMGSSGNSDCLRILAEKLRASRYQTVITTGNVVESRELKGFERDGLYVRDFLPGDRVIRASSKTLVICHGGIGTVYQAVENCACGIISIPAHNQHERIAKRLEEVGIAKTIPGGDLSGIEGIIDTMLSEPQGSYCAELQADLATYDGARKGKELVDRYLCRAL